MVAPDCTELRLSSAFEHLSGEPKLELIVTVLNVNVGHNAAVSYTHLDVYKRQECLMDVSAQNFLKFSGSFTDQSTVMFGSGAAPMLFKVFK